MKIIDKETPRNQGRGCTHACGGRNRVEGRVAVVVGEDESVDYEDGEVHDDDRDDEHLREAGMFYGSNVMSVAVERLYVRFDVTPMAAATTNVAGGCAVPSPQARGGRPARAGIHPSTPSTRTPLYHTRTRGPAAVRTDDVALSVHDGGGRIGPANSTSRRSGSTPNYGTRRGRDGTERGHEGVVTGMQREERRCGDAVAGSALRAASAGGGSILGPGDRLRRLGSRSGKGKIIEIALEARRPYHDLVSVDPEIVAEI